MEHRMTRTTRIVVALAAALAITAASASAHPGHSHTIMGTIASVNADRVEVTDKGNVKTVVSMTAKTKILVGKSAGTASDLAVGSRIVVEAREGPDKTFVALTVRLPARAAR